MKSALMAKSLNQPPLLITFIDWCSYKSLETKVLLVLVGIHKFLWDVWAQLYWRRIFGGTDSTLTYFYLHSPPHWLPSILFSPALFLHFSLTYSFLVFHFYPSPFISLAPFPLLPTSSSLLSHLTFYPTPTLFLSSSSPSVSMFFPSLFPFFLSLPLSMWEEHYNCQAYEHYSSRVMITCQYNMAVLVSCECCCNFAPRYTSVLIYIVPLFENVTTQIMSYNQLKAISLVAKSNCKVIFNLCTSRRPRTTKIGFDSPALSRFGRRSAMALFYIFAFLKYVLM